MKKLLEVVLLTTVRSTSNCSGSATIIEAVRIYTILPDKFFLKYSTFCETPVIEKKIVPSERCHWDEHKGQISHRLTGILLIELLPFSANLIYVQYCTLTHYYRIYT